jgi:hypothetical protein
VDCNKAALLIKTRGCPAAVASPTIFVAAMAANRVSVL